MTISAKERSAFAADHAAGLTYAELGRRYGLTLSAVGHRFFRWDLPPPAPRQYRGTLTPEWIETAVALAIQEAGL